MLGKITVRHIIYLMLTNWLISAYLHLCGAPVQNESVGL
jgi:hypothetical protein